MRHYFKVENPKEKYINRFPKLKVSTSFLFHYGFIGSTKGFYESRHKRKIVFPPKVTVGEILNYLSEKRRNNLYWAAQHLDSTDDSRYINSYHLRYMDDLDSIIIPFFSKFDPELEVVMVCRGKSYPENIRRISGTQEYESKQPFENYKYYKSRKK